MLVSDYLLWLNSIMRRQNIGFHTADIAKTRYRCISSRGGADYPLFIRRRADDTLDRLEYFTAHVVGDSFPGGHSSSIPSDFQLSGDAIWYIEEIPGPVGECRIPWRSARACRLHIMAFPHSEYGCDCLPVDTNHKSRIVIYSTTEYYARSTCGVTLTPVCQEFRNVSFPVDRTRKTCERRTDISYVDNIPAGVKP